MRRVGDGFLLIRSEGHWKLDGLTVGFLENIGMNGNIPRNPAIKMFDDANVYRLFLVIAELDLKRLIQPLPVYIQPVVGAAALAGKIKGIARIDAHRFVARSVVNYIFAGELDLAVTVATVEAHATLGQRHSQVVNF